VCYRTCNLHTENPSNANQETKDASDDVAPHEGRPVPIAARGHGEELAHLTAEYSSEAEEDGGAEVGPVGELCCAAVDVGQGGFDEDCVDCDGERCEEAVE